MNPRIQFARTATDLVETDLSVALVYAEISGQFWGDVERRHPDRVINVGIREQLLVNVGGADQASIAILRGPQIIFFRTRGAEADGTLADLVHQTAMYYEDRLQGGGFTRAVICGASGDDVRRTLEQRLGLPVEPLDIRAAAALTDRITVAPALLDALAPLAGLLLRGGEKAA